MCPLEVLKMFKMLKMLVLNLFWSKRWRNEYNLELQHVCQALENKNKSEVGVLLCTWRRAEYDPFKFTLSGSCERILKLGYVRLVVLEMQRKVHVSFWSRPDWLTLNCPFSVYGGFREMFTWEVRDPAGWPVCHGLQETGGKCIFPDIDVGVYLGFALKSIFVLSLIFLKWENWGQS